MGGPVDPNVSLQGTDSLVADTFSLTDTQLADSIEFLEEIGFGNWGSVWSCRSRIGQTRRKLAVKLVHRTTERTTAARVRSIWNKMKVVRTLKDDRHPAIIDFHSFIITPSYALITMEYLPRLVPVEVRESKAKTWFTSLLGGVAHLHARGIVHNDIKPANILLSRTEQPVLVDFGFAERYDLADPSSSAYLHPSSAAGDKLRPRVPFESSLAYGTPEYLSPERARGFAHDTRKADVWSLGVTFFEIITGRTPFEEEEEASNVDGEGGGFTSKDELERYWSRTNSGTWVGSWKMSHGLEKILRRMIEPTPKLRISSQGAIVDPYFSALTLDADITTTTLRITSKKIANATAPISSPHVDTTTRSKLSALQNLMTKQPTLPVTVASRPSSALAVHNRKPSGSAPRTSTHLASKENSRSPSPLGDVPVSHPIPQTTATITSISLSKAFFSSAANHARTKSGTATPLTPKAIAHKAPPAPPPPTPATPATDAVHDQATSRVISRMTFAPRPRTSPSRSALSPIKAGKENGTGNGVSSVKVRVKAIESRAPPPDGPPGVTKPRSVLRMKDRNRVAIPAAVEVVKKNSAARMKEDRDRKPVKQALVKKDSNLSSLNKENLVPSNPSFLEKSLPTPVKDAKPSRGRRALHAISRSVDLTRSPAPSPTEHSSPMAHIRHSVRKSIDKTAERLGKISSAKENGTLSASLSKGTSKLRKSTTELRDSWEDLENERLSHAAAVPTRLETVQDMSLDDISPPVLLPEPPIVEEYKSVVRSDSASNSHRLSAWIQDVESVAGDFQPQASASPMPRNVSRKSSESAALYGTHTRKSTESGAVMASLPPPKRRGSASASRMPSRPQSRNHSTHDLVGPLGQRSAHTAPLANLAAVADELDDVAAQDHSADYPDRNVRARTDTLQTISSSTPPTDMPTIPTIAVDELDRSTRVNDTGEETYDYHLEPSRTTFRTPDTTLDLARMAREVGVNTHPWSTPRSGSPAMFPPVSPPTVLTSVTPVAGIRPPSPPRPNMASESVLIASENVVRVGKGFESTTSHLQRGGPRGATSSSTYYSTHQPTEYIASSSAHTRDHENVVFAPSTSHSTSTSESLGAHTKKHDRRRSGLFATLRGREQLQMAAEALINGPSPPPPSAFYVEEWGSPVKGSYAYHRSGTTATPTDRNNTLSRRMKKMFNRVVSQPALNFSAVAAT